MKMLCVVSFLNEERHLPVLLESIAGQQRRPDLLLLVDDGSTDRSAEITAAFAEGRHDVSLLRRPRRPRQRDRLAAAAELQSFRWALSQTPGDWELIAKMDADLQLSPDLLATLERAFAGDPELGIAGAVLSVRGAGGELLRERCPAGHVRGATKFYRRACLEQIAPIPPILGWDTIDEIAARGHGWRTESFECALGDTVHLRPTGAGDGMLRAHRRWGACAWGIGQHPLWIGMSAARRVRDRPRVLGSVAFLAGWAGAALRRSPRAAGEVRAFGRREQLRRIRALIGRAQPV
jgi:glycosyltransferase involved in cell wall biosynthesis